MCGHISLIRRADGLEQATKLRLGDATALDGVRGLEAGEADVVAANMTSRAEVDALVAALAVIRECLPAQLTTEETRP